MVQWPKNYVICVLVWSGETATQRLEQLDQQRSDWKQRVQSYLDERKTIVDSNMIGSAKRSSNPKKSNHNNSIDTRTTTFTNF